MADRGTVISPDDISNFVETHPRAPAYTYEGKLKRVIDGDTIEMTVRLGFSVYTDIKVRMAGYDAPELRTKDEREKIAGEKAKLYLESLLQDFPLLVQTVRTNRDTDKKGKYGRYIGTVFLRDLDMNVNATMIRYLATLKNELQR